MYYLNQIINSKEKEQQFKEAVIQSNLVLLNKCLESRINPNCEFDDGNYALQLTAEKCDFPIMRVLLTINNIDLDKQNSDGMTALMTACIVNCRELVQMLLKKNADPNIKTDNGNTALHYACNLSNMGMVFDLVSHGAKINDCNTFDVSPLTIAIIDKPSMIIAKFLLLKGGTITRSNQFPLFLETALACNNKIKLEIFKLLVKYGMDIHQTHPIENRNCLHYAAFAGYVPLGEYLITLNLGYDLYHKDATGAVKEDDVVYSKRYEGRTPMDIALDHKNYITFHLYQILYIKMIHLSSTTLSQHRFNGHNRDDSL